MALSPSDRAFYEEKLGWRGFMYLFAATVGTGAIALPLLLYVQDFSQGQAAGWTFKVFGNFALLGILLGMVLSVIMYALARFYLWMGWLPRRR